MPGNAIGQIPKEGVLYLIETKCKQVNSDGAQLEKDELCLMYCERRINRQTNDKHIIIYYNLKHTDDIRDLENYFYEVNKKKQTMFKWGKQVGKELYLYSQFSKDWDLKILGTTNNCYMTTGKKREWDSSSTPFFNFVLMELDKFADKNATTAQGRVQESLLFATEAKKLLRDVNYDDIQIAHVVDAVTNNTTAIVGLGESRFQDPLDYDRSEEIRVDSILIANHIRIKNCRIVPKEEHGRTWSKKPFIHLWFIFNGSLIAGIGLATNSGPVVVASMLVSSMMEPIKGMMLSLRYICSSKRKCKHKQIRRFCCHFMTLLIDVCICILVGMFIGWIVAMPSDATSPYSIMEELSGLNYGKNETTVNIRTPDEISGRAKPIGLLISMVIALASALALITADKQDNKSALVGIGISASLLPPAVNAGILWSLESAQRNCVTFDIFDHVFDDCDLTFGEQGTISLALTFVNVGVIIFVWAIGYQFRNWCMKSHMRIKSMSGHSDNRKQRTKENEVFTWGKNPRFQSLNEEQPLIQF